MDIYLDVLVVLNIYMTWLLISLTAMLSRTPSKPGWRALASFFGGFSSLIILIPTDVKLLAFTLLVLKFLLGAATVFIGFWGSTVRRRLLLVPAFLGVNMLASAFLELIERAVGTPLIAVYSGFVYFDISPLNLVLTTAAIYAALTISAKLFSKNLGAEGAYRVNFRIGCKAFSLDGFADTGNTARDLFSGLPVIICTGTMIENCAKIRAVPYKTISGEGVLYAVAPDELTLTNERGETKSVDALVAGLPEGERRAVFNPKILNTK